MQFGYCLFAGFFAGSADAECIERLVHPSDTADHRAPYDRQICLVDEKVFRAKLVHVAGVELGHERIVKVAFDLRRHVAADDRRVDRKARRREIAERRVAVEQSAVQLGLVHRLEGQAAELDDPDKKAALRHDQIVIDMAQVWDVHRRGLFAAALTAKFQVGIEAHGE